MTAPKCTLSDRERSIAEYIKMCLATGKAHDWRHATDAPGWIVGDECVRCQACQLKAIAALGKDSDE